MHEQVTPAYQKVLEQWEDYERAFHPDRPCDLRQIPSQQLFDEADADALVKKYDLPFNIEPGGQV
jgi:hypothetical protein